MNLECLSPGQPSCRISSKWNGRPYFHKNHSWCFVNALQTDLNVKDSSACLCSVLRILLYILQIEIKKKNTTRPQSSMLIYEGWIKNNVYFLYCAISDFIKGGGNRGGDWKMAAAGIVDTSPLILDSEEVWFSFSIELWPNTYHFL